MTISTIRRANDHDLANVLAAAIRFCDRHGIQYESPADAERAIWSAEEDDSRIRKLWAACYCRALGVTTSVRVTISSGHVGLTME